MSGALQGKGSIESLRAQGYDVDEWKYHEFGKLEATRGEGAAYEYLAGLGRTREARQAARNRSRAGAPGGISTDARRAIGDAIDEAGASTWDAQRGIPTTGRMFDGPGAKGRSVPGARDANLQTDLRALVGQLMQAAAALLEGGRVVELDHLHPCGLLEAHERVGERIRQH